MRTIRAVISGCLFGGFMGGFFALQYGLASGAINGLVTGLLFGTGIYFFITSKMIDKQTQIVVNADESIVLSDGANHFLNGEGVGGKLYLLNDRVQFKSHRFNIQNHEFEIGIADVEEVRFYNIYGIIPAGLEIRTTAGGKEKFVIHDRDKWKTAIVRIKGA
ncbi:hypothetical protein [Mucilaginibacter xinganensis]|uniref:GRAM domain-containing protein n=1 Tax=Mucilaginibacter xinganensis TaxID=1234841 RepID=A0A223P1X0_9SPHI|nr:hypothetical protein [Mucilaginibacter xinganensis]ASU35821.1 hypothetical protein MuYL_3936 [Mucilaginibacter xinganensis]